MCERSGLDLISELLKAPSPSGREEQLAEIICRKLEALRLPFTKDAAGNVVVQIPGRNSNAGPLMLAAHMDEIGMVVTAIDDDGLLHVDNSGGLVPYKIGEGPVQIIGQGEGVTGALGMGSSHRADAADRVVCWRDVRIITGLSAQQLAAREVRVGSSVVPARFVCGPVVFGDDNDPLVAAWTFDDRAGVATLLRLLETMQARVIKPARPTLVCFTVNEEGGCHGAKVAAARHRPEVFIAVDGCPIPPGVNLALDGRPGIWSKDRITHFDQKLIGALCGAAAQAGTEFQVAVYDSAASDASKVYEVGAAERVATVGHVRENSHGYEVARLSVFDNLLAALVKFMETWE